MVILSIVIWLLMSSTWMVGVTLGFPAMLLRLSAWSWLAAVIYFFVLEGGWGASLGKRLMGLRVTSQTDARWWLRVGLVYRGVPRARPSSRAPGMCSLTSCCGCC